MADFVIYHNPRCSKSRQTLQLLNDNSITPEVILYLETPPDLATLKALVKKLGLSSPRELLRTKEAEYAEAGLQDTSLSDTAVLEAVVRYPKLLERPIVVHGNRAVIGRPPENVLQLIN